MKKLFKFLLIGSGLFFTLFFLIIIIMNTMKPDDPAKKEEALTKLKKEYSVLAGLKEKIPPVSSLNVKACPDSEINSAVKGEKKWVSVIPFEYFSVFEGTPAWKEMKKDWGWLYPHNDSFFYLDELPNIGLRKMNDLLWKISMIYKDSPYLGFLITTQKSLPKVADEKPFTGSLKGWIVIIDLKTQKMVCQVDLEVQNSQEIKYRTRGMFGKNADEALLGDFKEQYKKEVQNALGKISKSLAY